MMEETSNYLEFHATDKNQIISAINTCFHEAKWNPESKIKKILNAAPSSQSEEDLLIDLNYWILREWRKSFPRLNSEVKFTGKIKKGPLQDGFVIYLPLDPKEPKIVGFSLWRNKEMLTVSASHAITRDKFFGRILHKLSGDFRNLKMPVTINGETYWLASWMSIWMCRLVNDSVSMGMYYDEVAERGY